MRFPRASGILLHPTSLPGPHGVGELGPAAFAFVDFLEKAGQKLWQILPLGPTGYGNSPYGCYSAFAGNPYLISLELLVEQGLLKGEALEPLTHLPVDRVDFDAMWKLKEPLLQEAFQTFRREGSAEQKQAFRGYCEAPQVASWLEDYALFMALKRVHDGKAWTEWAPELARREPGAIRAVQAQLGEQIWYERFLQFIFDSQWAAVRRYARQKGIEIIGDIPIYISDDSADTWSHPEMFYLNEKGKPTVVAGVPPDYFSKTGQLWGNPLYRWDYAERTGYTWWIHRFRVLFARVDRVRLDHFRGFEAYWEIPAGEETAINGRWVKGPGDRMFKAVERALGVMPIIAEDLGIITPEVEALRDEFNFPGMRILQFAFGGDNLNPYLPHNYCQNSVVYTGTHDNDTLVGWLTAEKPEIIARIQALLGTSETDLRMPLIRAALASVADTCITPLQDLLGLPTGCRMNTPSEKDGNWLWRVEGTALTDALAEELKRLCILFNRTAAAKATE